MSAGTLAAMDPHDYLMRLALGHVAGRDSDRIALTVSGGMHRTKDEHGALMAAAGFQQTRVVPTEAQVTLIEGRPV